MITPHVIIPGTLDLKTLEEIYRRNICIAIDTSSKTKVDVAAQIVADAAQGHVAVYGVNTGFGKLAQTRICPEDTARLQRNLILSHCCGVGENTPQSIVRLMMSLKLNSLGRGASGVRWVLIELLQNMLKENILPVVPVQGSVGASGDLAPLAHMAAAMIGEGTVDHNGEEKNATQALKDAGLEPLELAAKEGLALINGTQFSCAYALAGFFEARRLAHNSLITGALSTDAAMGSAAPFRPEVHALRGMQGQIQAATILTTLMKGSQIRESHRTDDDRVQDPYCLRCQPQVMGAVLDIFGDVAVKLQTEANAVTDNPLVIVETGDIVSGGNFHAEPVAFAADQLAIAIAETGTIAQRRIAMLVDPVMNFGLPAFLSPAAGLNSGFMIAEVTSAALMSENKQRANPCSVDSTPTSANQEDHVSMAAHGARRLMDMTDNLSHILGIEWLVAAQGVELRSPLVTSPHLKAAIDKLRKTVPPLEEDRFLADELTTAAQLISAGNILEDAELSIFPSYL